MFVSGVRERLLVRLTLIMDSATRAMEPTSTPKSNTSALNNLKTNLQNRSNGLCHENIVFTFIRK